MLMYKTEAKVRQTLILIESGEKLEGRSRSGRIVTDIFHRPVLSETRSCVKDHTSGVITLFRFRCVSVTFFEKGNRCLLITNKFSTFQSCISKIVVFGSTNLRVLKC